MFDKKTMQVINSRQKCPCCGEEVRIFNCTTPWRYEVRCQKCRKVWPLETKPETYRGTIRLTGKSARKATAEWNAISMKERKEAGHEGT